MANKLQVIDPNYLAVIWPEVRDYLEQSLLEGEEQVEEVPNWNGCYNIYHVQSFISNGTWLLVVAVEDGIIKGAATVSFMNYPMSRVAVITLTGGKLVTGENEFYQLTALLKTYGATKVQAYCRESVARMLKRRGFEPVSTLVEVQI